MYHELEDVIVLDQEAGRIYNFSDIVPQPLREEELTENLDSVLKDGQVRLGVEYFSEGEEADHLQRALTNGGTHLPAFRQRLTHILSLPPCHCKDNIQEN